MSPQKPTHSTGSTAATSTLKGATIVPPPPKQRSTRDMQRILLWVCFVLAAIAIGAVIMLIPSLVFMSGLPAGSARDFTDGNGIYVFNEGKYGLLIWKKKLFTPGAAPQESDIAAAAQSAIPVKKGVRFFSYGLDFSKWQVVPPYAMAFCIIRDPHTIDGVYPIRIKLVDKIEPIYELLPPQLIDTLSPGTLWVINYQYSCTDGWVFKFQ
jgi:hypothetical protein